MIWLFVSAAVLLFVVVAGLDAKQAIRSATREALPEFEPRIGGPLRFLVLGTMWILVNMGIFASLLGRPEHMMIGFIGVQVATLDMPLKNKQDAIGMISKKLGVEDLEVKIS